MLKLRKSHADLFIHGDFDPLSLEDPNTFGFLKSWGEQKAFIMLSFSQRPQPGYLAKGFRDDDLMLSTCERQSGDLAPFEGRLYVRS